MLSLLRFTQGPAITLYNKTDRSVFLTYSTIAAISRVPDMGSVVIFSRVNAASKRATADRQ